VGAVLVLGDEVIARAHNSTAGTCDPIAHAEILCIREAAQQLGSWRLLDATLYCTLEPCAMCAGAMLQSRVGTLVYGARNDLSGEVSHVMGRVHARRIGSIKQDGLNELGRLKTLGVICRRR